MSTTRTPITREVFISPSHVQVALRGPNYPQAPAMMSIVTDEGELKDVPVPFEWVQRNFLPAEFAVDFLFDPEEAVAKLNNAGLHYMEDVPDQLYQKMAEVVNRVDNLKIVPLWLYNQKRGLISAAVAHGVAPEAIVEHRRLEKSREEQGYEGEEGGSSSGQRKEKKKGIFKSLFGGKK